MAEAIGRLGFLGLAIEATAGTPEATPDIFVPYIENSLRGHHEPIMDIAARTSRVKDASSVGGKKWGEGSVEIYLDATNTGYLLKSAFGQEARVEKNASPPTHDHLFTPTVSGNAVTAMTLWDDKQVDTERYSNAAIDTLEITINNDGLATISAGIMAKFPATVASPTLTTPSGTLYTWKDLSLLFGDTVGEADAASAIKVVEVTITQANNLTLNYKSGSQEPDTITTGPLEVTGSYKLFFENVTDRDRYYNLTKKTMIVRLVGADLGSGFNERLDFVFKKIVIEDIEYDSDLDDLFALTANFRAELDRTQTGYEESTLRNGKSTNYS